MSPREVPFPNDDDLDIKNDVDELLPYKSEWNETIKS